MVEGLFWADLTPDQAVLAAMRELASHYATSDSEPVFDPIEIISYINSHGIRYRDHIIESLYRLSAWGFIDSKGPGPRWYLTSRFYKTGVKVALSMVESAPIPLTTSSVTPEVISTPDPQPQVEVPAHHGELVYHLRGEPVRICGVPSDITLEERLRLAAYIICAQ